MMLCFCFMLWLSFLNTLSSKHFEFTIEPKSVVVRQEDPAILNCQTNVQSDLVIYWRKGWGASWISSYKNKSYGILANNSLYFPRVGKDEEDVYFCGAFLLDTQKTVISNPAFVTLAYIKSDFIQPPSPATVREHTTVTLTCVSGASVPLPMVTWEKNNAPIVDFYSMAQNHLFNSNATAGTLHLKNVSLADAGYYACVAVNPLLPNERRTSPQALLVVLPKDDKPRIEVHPRNTIYPIHHPLQWNCVIVGVPSPVIQWVHNGRQVVNTSRKMVFVNGSLYIKSLSHQDNGQYSCNGTNNKGSVASSYVFLSVAYIDYMFKLNPKNTTAVNGSRVELQCQPPAHFPNKISYKWYKDYKVLTIDGRTKILTSGSLVFSHVLKSDEGVYLCEATNTFVHEPRTSTDGHLTVNVPPYFLSMPSNKTVILFDDLHLTCLSQGSPQPRVMWYHGNTLLRNNSRRSLGSDGSLHVTAVESSDGGIYKCSIENVAGNKVAEAVVVVYVPPNGTIIPRNTSVILGNNASFHCQFDGNPPPLARWYFSPNKKKQILLSKNRSHFIQTKEQLHIVNVTEQHKGWFTCVGKNFVGLQNFSAYLNVLVPAHLVTLPRNTTVNQSDAAEISCSCYGNPQPTMTWSKDGRMLSTTSSKTTFNLRIVNALKNDTGTYLCTARNYLGNETSSAYLTVQVSPTIHFILGPSRVQRRANVTFHCKLDGVPNPEIEWFKDGYEIKHIKGIFAEGDDLFITSATGNDTGNYTCKASNVVGSAVMVKQLLVEVPPQRPCLVQFGGGSSTSLHVLWQSGFDGYNPIKLFRVELRTNLTSWVNVSDSVTRKNLTIKGLQPHTVYYVRVFARNGLGWSEPSEIIKARTEEDFPSRPVNVNCGVVNASAISLTWNKPVNPNGVIRQYRIQYKTLAGSTVQARTTSAELSHVISGLQTFTYHQFRLQASTGIKNSSLWGNFTSFITCRSGEAAPTVAPQNLTLTSVGWNTILARWQVIPEDSSNGIVRSYCVRYKKTFEERYKKLNVTGNKIAEYNISGLDAWTEYVVQVAAITIDRGPWSKKRTSRTFESEPSGPPTDILVKGNTSQSLLISWSPPLAAERNGVIVGYTVVYNQDTAHAQNRSVITNETSLMLSGLLIFTSYGIQIRAFTAIGYGPFSDRKVARTLESYPGAVEGVTMSITNSSVLVTWRSPSTPNGVITSYTVYFNTTVAVTTIVPGTNMSITNTTIQSQQTTTQLTKVILAGIHGNVTYSLCVAASTSIGYGKCSDPIIFTTHFSLKATSKPEVIPGEFTPSIVSDHLPLVVGAATIFVLIIIFLFTCCMIKRRNRKNEESRSKKTFNFRGHSFQMGSDDDGQSSVASRSSKPVNNHSIESSSMHSRTNPSNTFAARQGEGRDNSPVVRLRNNSLYLGSDASSYDDPYSSVAEIGVDLTSVIPTSVPVSQQVPDHGHAAENPLYAGRERRETFSQSSDGSSLSSHIAANPLYAAAFDEETPQESGVVAQTTGNGDEKQTAKIPVETARADPVSPMLGASSEGSMEGIEYFSSDDENAVLPVTYEQLVLPPPPPEFSDFSENQYDVPESHQKSNNLVTDF